MNTIFCEAAVYGFGVLDQADFPLSTFSLLIDNGPARTSHF